jgi:hypothetical protein
MIKVGKTSFQESVIKEMTLKQFKSTYENILKGENLDEVYEKVTGKKVKKDEVG